MHGAAGGVGSMVTQLAREAGAYVIGAGRAAHRQTCPSTDGARFRRAKEDWVQRVVAGGHAICILPEHSAAAPGLVTRPIEGLSLERELVIATVLGSTTPAEIRKIAQLASTYEWQ